MGYMVLTAEEKQKVASTDLLYLVMQRGYPLKEYARGYYKIPGYGGLLIKPDKNSWWWENKDIGGGPIQFLQQVENKSWQEAVQILLTLPETAAGVSSGSHYRKSTGRRESNRTQDQEKPEEKKFTLPAKADTYKHVFAYLIHSRGIHPDIVRQMVAEHKIYEDRNQNCVFVGYDSTDKARFASLRGTKLNIPFKGNPEGADKRYPFCKEGTTDTVYVFEAPIDLLSFLTLQIETGQNTDNHYIALAGVSLMGLSGYITAHPEIRHIVVCTDADKEGETCYENIKKAYSRYQIERITPAPEKDINAWLMRKHMEDQMKVLELAAGAENPG